MVYLSPPKAHRRGAPGQQGIAQSPQDVGLPKDLPGTPPRLPNLRGMTPPPSRCLLPHALWQCAEGFPLPTALLQCGSVLKLKDTCCHCSLLPASCSAAEYIQHVLNDSQKAWLAHTRACAALINVRAGPEGTKAWALRDLPMHQQADQ